MPLMNGGLIRPMLGSLMRGHQNNINKIIPKLTSKAHLNYVHENFIKVTLKSHHLLSNMSVFVNTHYIYVSLNDLKTLKTTGRPSNR